MFEYREDEGILKQFYWPYISSMMTNYVCNQVYLLWHHFDLSPD